MIGQRVIVEMFVEGETSKIRMQRARLAMDMANKAKGVSVLSSGVMWERKNSGKKVQVLSKTKD